MSGLTQEQIADARRFGVATLHEAAGRIGALPSAIKPLAPQMQLAGRAFNVQVPAGDNAVMPFPIFSNGVSIRGIITGFGAPAWLNQPIRAGDVVVKSGDLVIGDRDGVVVLPASEITAILSAAARRESDEAEKITRIRQGERTIDLYGFGAA